MPAAAVLLPAIPTTLLPLMGVHRPPVNAYLRLPSANTDTYFKRGRFDKVQHTAYCMHPHHQLPLGAFAVLLTRRLNRQLLYIVLLYHLFMNERRRIVVGSISLTHDAIITSGPGHMGEHSVLC